MAEEIDETKAELAPVCVAEGIDSEQFWGIDDEIQKSAPLAQSVESPVGARECLWSSADLKAGAWVELMVNGGWLRAQLSWVSPHRTLFMFVSRGGLAHSMSRRTMERLGTQGSIRFVSDGHVVDNVLDAVARTALQDDVFQAQPVSKSNVLAT
jgi:hypothetical protein